MSMYKDYVQDVLPGDTYFCKPKARAISYLRATLIKYKSKYHGWSKKRWRDSIL